MNKPVATITFDLLPTTFNEVINLERRNRFAAASHRKKETNLFLMLSKASKKRVVKYPVFIHFTWHCTSRRVDPDNRAFKKSVLDGLVRGGVLEDDRVKFIIGFHDTFTYDNTKESVTVEIFQTEEDFLKYKLYDVSETNLA